MAQEKVLFICLGNICRSPTAEAVFKHRSKTAGLSLLIESAGTGAWHAGDPPDPRAQEAGVNRGYSFKGQRARKVTQDDFEKFDYILAMDKTNLTQLTALCPQVYKNKVELFLNYAQNTKERDVPDPYYGGTDGFEHVLDLVEAASDGLISAIKAKA